MMAGGNKHQPIADTEAELMSQLAYRDDLAEAIGIIVQQPPHSVDSEGNIVWGDWYDGGMSVGHSSVYEELEQVIKHAVEIEHSENKDLPPLDRKIPTHSYDHPPAAQSIPEILAVMYERGMPILEDGTTVATAAALLVGVSRKVKAWFQQKNLEIGELNQPSYVAGEKPPHKSVEAKITFTQGAILTLLVAELVRRVGYQPDLAIDCQARGFYGHNSPGHPNPSITYLIRVSFDGDRYGYVITSQAEVIEHFQVRKEEFESLPIPDLLQENIEPLDKMAYPEKLRLRMQHPAKYR